MPKTKSALQDKPTLIAQAAVSDTNNWLTARAKGAAVDGMKMGLSSSELENFIEDNLLEGSDAALDRIADEVGRSAVAGGRFAAFEELDSEIGKYVRSEAMDQNTCDTCAEHDDDEWDSLDEVDWSPGDDCEGGDNCRGQLIPVFADEGTTELEEQPE